jgi:hypothetical protein
MSPHHQPGWLHTENGLAITLGLRTDPVPTTLAERLLAPTESGTTADPAEDLISLEGRLRATVAELTAHATRTEHAVVSARRRLADAQTGPWLGRRRRRRRCNAELAAAVTAQAEVRNLLDDALMLRDTLRNFVITLDAPAGLLRQAADGWKRLPDVPATVIVMGAQDNFLAADPRRTRRDWGYPEVDAEIFGEQWRRDGDDDGPYTEPADRSGPWRVGYIPRTGEIFASRHCGYLAQEVWLLGKDFGAWQARELLEGLLPRMREPNSLILVAGAVHAARTLRATHRSITLRRPGHAAAPEVADTGASG